jgi:hypothetical protein
MRRGHHLLRVNQHLWNSETVLTLLTLEEQLKSLPNFQSLFHFSDLAQYLIDEDYFMLMTLPAEPNAQTSRPRLISYLGS